MVKKRRDLLKAAAAASAFAALPKFSMAQAGCGKIKVAIVGCGRGGGLIAEYMMKADADISITALADLFEDKAEALHAKLLESAKRDYPANPEIYAVKKENIFTGWDSYKAAIASGADLIAFATPPVFRPQEALAAANAGKHLFLDKPAAVDAPGARQISEASKICKEKNLSAACGLQRRGHAGYTEAVKRVQDGQIGDIVGAQCYWMFPHYEGMELVREDLSPDDMEYQIRNWHAFIWAGGDQIVEQQIHSLDVARWVLGGAPSEIMGVGGRAITLPAPKYGNRYSHFAVDFDYGQKGRLQTLCRQEPKTAPYILERFAGTKGALETNLFGVQKITGQNPWQAAQSQSDGRVEIYQKLFASVRNSSGFNMLDDFAESTLLGIAGRLAAYSGKKFKFDWVRLRSSEVLAPKEFKFGALPVAPVPVPGEYKLT